LKSKILFILLALIIGIASIAQAKEKTKEKWKEHRSSHFIIYYNDAPSDFIKSVSDTAEHYYGEITRNLGFYRTESWSWDKRASIYIYNDADDYVEKSKQASWSHGAAQVKDKIIRTFPSDHGFFDSTLPHELGHIIFREFVGFKSRIPMWMDEGVAMYQEKAKRWGANRVVKKAMKEGSLVSIPDLTEVRRLDNSTPREYVNLFYAESASIIYYLITELGRYRFVNFCKELKRGKRFDYALKEAYRRFENLEDLNESWVSYLKRQ